MLIEAGIDAIESSHDGHAGRRIVARPQNTANRIAGPDLVTFGGRSEDLKRCFEDLPEERQIARLEP